MDEVLAHARDEEHLVVHRQTEQHAHQDDRHEADDRADLVDVQRLCEPAPFEDGGDDAEGGGDRQEVAEGGLDRHPDRAEDHREEDQRQADDEDAERDERAAEAVGDVDRDRGEAGDLQVDAVLVEEPIVLRPQIADELCGRWVVGRSTIACSTSTAST